MKHILPLVAILFFAPHVQAQEPAATAVSEARLKADIDRLVAFGTRHTLSSQDDAQRGIGAARRWAEAQFRTTAKGCGGCLDIVLPETMVEGSRIPGKVRLVDVVAIQRGTERPNEVVIVQAHIDSRASDVMDATSDAPGANDDGSGSALVLEAARVLSQQKYPSTIVYALLSGEEQGLFGGQLLADYAQKQGWTVKAVLNNDIVGGSHGSDGFHDDGHVRVFSEGPRGDATEQGRATMRRDGGENDSPARNLSRYIARIAANNADGLAVRQVWRADRMGRGGDQLPFLEKGYPAVRFSVAVEDYEHQHQDVRVEDGVTYGDTADEMDFPYLAKVTRLNVRVLAMLANAPMPPAPVAQAAVQTFTDLKWKAVSGARGYTVWQRRTNEPNWAPAPLIADVVATSTRLEGVRGDDWFFGVSARGADGSMSPIASAVPGGAFQPGPRE